MDAIGKANQLAHCDVVRDEPAAGQIFAESVFASGNVFLYGGEVRELRGVGNGGSENDDEDGPTYAHWERRPWAGGICKEGFRDGGLILQRKINPPSLNPS